MSAHAVGSRMVRGMPAILVAITLSARAWADQAESALSHGEILPEEKQNFAYRWLNVTQEVSARDVDRHGPRPTVLSRMMAIWATAMFDAWAAYDQKAVGSRLGGTLRRPLAEQTPGNKKKAISYASYYALADVFPADVEYLASEMRKVGYDPRIKSTDAKRPEGVGYLAAKALLEFRRHDGANQLGDEHGSNGQPYSDYTFYRCVNSAEECIDPDCWQPITFTTADGTKSCPEFLTPHWYRVKPFVLAKAEQFRPPPPPRIKKDAARLKNEVDEVLAYNRELTAEQKAIVEFMRDGPRSTGQSGHWLRFAQDVSRRDYHDLDRDVKLYFVIANVAFDAFISCWETKRTYDSSRPWTLVRYFYAGQKIAGWAGPAGGVKEVAAEDWRPYSPEAFITPPFPGYTSGHATVSGACAKTLELFTGSDRFGVRERRNCCLLTERSGGALVTLDLPTFSATAEMAALSRAMGGYHIPTDNNVGLQIGRQLAVWSWPKYESFFDGSAAVASSALPDPDK